MTRFTNLALNWLIGGLLIFGGSLNVRAADGGNIVDVAESAGSFQTLLAAAQAADLVETLTGKGPLTLFAPTDEAFAKLPESTLKDLLKPENKWKLQAILTYHVLPGKVLAKDVLQLKSANTVFGQDVAVNINSGKVRINNANVLQTDILASNGVVHAIDSVLLPKDIIDLANSTGMFETLIAAIDAADLTATLKNDGPFTVFAPTDEAFVKLPAGTIENLLRPENKGKLQEILTHHVVPGRVLAKDVMKLKSVGTVSGKNLTISSASAVKINGANLVRTDVIALNGVIHVIDSVLLPK